MQKADLKIDLPCEVWEVNIALKTAPWLLISILLHLLLGMALWYSTSEDTSSLNEEIVDLTLSQPSTPLGQKNSAGSGAQNKVKVVLPPPPSQIPGASAIPQEATNPVTNEGIGDEGGSGTGAVGWGEVTRFPKVLREIKALYPDEAKKAGIDGPVIMEILIDQTGKVRNVKLISGPGYGLNESALAAIRQFEFQPAQKGSDPVTVKIRYTYRFKLGVN